MALIDEVDPAGIRSGPTHRFNGNRLLRITGLPDAVTALTLKEFLETTCKVDVESLRLEAPDPELGDRAARVLLRPAQNYAACAARVTSHPFGSHPFALGAPRLDGLLFLGNLPDKVTPEKLLELGLKSGPVHRCFLMCQPESGESLGYGFVEFLTRDQAVRARSDLASYVVHERPIRVDVMRPIDFAQENFGSRTLFIDRLPKTLADAVVLRQMLEQAGAVEYCELVTSHGQPRGFAFVDCTDFLAACKVRHLCNGQEFMGTNIRISFGHPQKTGEQIIQGKLEVQRQRQRQSPMQHHAHRPPMPMRHSSPMLFHANTGPQAPPLSPRMAHAHGRPNPGSPMMRQRSAPAMVGSPRRRLSGQFQGLAQNQGFFYPNPNASPYNYNPHAMTGAMHPERMAQGYGQQGPQPPMYYGQQQQHPGMGYDQHQQHPGMGYDQHQQQQHPNMGFDQQAFRPQEVGPYSAPAMMAHPMEFPAYHPAMSYGMPLPADAAAPSYNDLMTQHAFTNAPQQAPVPASPWQHMAPTSPGAESMYAMMLNLTEGTPGSQPISPLNQVQHAGSPGADPMSPYGAATARPNSRRANARVVPTPRSLQVGNHEDDATSGSGDDGSGVSPLPQDDEVVVVDKENAAAVPVVKLPSKSSIGKTSPLASVSNHSSVDSVDSMTNGMAGISLLNSIAENAATPPKSSRTSGWGLKTPTNSKVHSKDPSPSMLGGTRVSPGTQNAKHMISPISRPNLG